MKRSAAVGRNPDSKFHIQEFLLKKRTFALLHCRVATQEHMAEGEGFERFTSIDNMELLEKKAITKRTNRQNCAKLERIWNIAFSSPACM
jgi:hypothetical protein